MALPEQTVIQIWGMSPVKGYKGRMTPAKTTFDDLVAGVELEIENLPAGLAAYADLAHPFWSVVEDGSLRPRGASWEFVSRPAPLGTMLSEMGALFEKLGVNDTNYSDRCSVHIHTNVQDFTQGQLANLMLVYPVFEEVLFQYVNHHKKQEEQGYCRDTNLYCIPWSACRMNRRFVEKLFNSPASIRHWQKYTAVNMLPLQDKGTVEWRHMHGTADMEKLTTWVNIIGAIMRYCKTQSFDDIVKTIKLLNDVSTYQQFFEAVLLGTLPYSEEYRRLMADGVVTAKHSLVNWEIAKSKPRKDVKASLYDSMWLEATPGNPLRRTDPGTPQPVNIVNQMDDLLDAQMEAEWNRGAARVAGTLPAGDNGRIDTERAIIDREIAQRREMIDNLANLGAARGANIGTARGAAPQFADRFPIPRPAPRRNGR